MVVAIVGASGAVGQELLKVLEERHFPITELRLFGSVRSAGTEYSFNSQSVTVQLLEHGEAFKGVDIAFVSAGGSVSLDYADEITRYGAVMIDNSSAFRMDKDVPLVIPEVNKEDVFNCPRHIIANPNCSTIVMALPLKALHSLSPIKRVHVATYQAASGAGAQAMQELQNQYVQLSRHEPVSVSRFPHQLAYNVIPHIDVFTPNDYTKEEMKMHNETRKIFHSETISVSATCVRVPSLRCHSESVWVETEHPVSVENFKHAIVAMKGCTLMDEPADNRYPMPLDLSGTDEVFVGRIRQDYTSSSGITFWCVGDQIRKGAALNAVQIAEVWVNK